jgi:TRAP-type C4-dicarboxylate transport system substrate-binding protein
MNRSWKIAVAVIVVVMMLSTVVAGMSCSGTAGTAQTSQLAAKAVVLRLSIPSPEGDDIVTNAENFAKDFNAQAKGKYVIEIHPGESLVKFPDSLDALRTGAVEMDLWPMGAFSSVDPNFAAAELPFLVNSVEADAALQVETLPLYDSILSKKFNSRAVYTHTCLGIDMISNKEVKTAADWKGMLVQSVSPQTAKVIDLMGGASVPMTFSDAYQGIQKKIIAGTLQSSSMMIAFKLNEVAKYVLRGYLTPANCVVAINQDAYNKMPKDMQDLLMAAGKRAQADTDKFFVNAYWKNYTTLASSGVSIYILPKAERDLWAQKIQPYCDELYSKMDPDFAKKLKDIGTKLDKSYPYTEQGK